MKIKRCPICKTEGFEITQYKEEGGWCNQCNIWVVPQSSRKGIINARGLESDFHIQFHVNGNPTQTWKEYQIKEIKKLEEDTRILKPKIQKRTALGKLRHLLFQRSNYRCEDCGATNKEIRLEIDHIIPWVNGGKTTIENLQVLCRKCNRSKHTREWRAGE